MISYKSVLDLGANDGYFSRLLAKENKMVLAVDSDSRCINNLTI
jgi:2-polyprenyl-3-methyl-5-hydroxy-6-metoxy-1,4-benzoquinol methylase